MEAVSILHRDLESACTPRMVQSSAMSGWEADERIRRANVPLGAGDLKPQRGAYSGGPAGDLGVIGRGFRERVRAAMNGRHWQRAAVEFSLPARALRQLWRGVVGPRHGLSMTSLCAG